MRIDDQVTQVHDHAVAAASLGDERTQQIASGLAIAITPAVRLAIMGALGAAADEITAALLDTPGSPAVLLQLDGDEVRIDVRPTAAPVAVGPADEGDTSARISLRLSEALKTDIESAARAEGASVNTWLVRAATAALSASARARQPGPWADLERDTTRNHRVTGWINS